MMNKIKIVQVFDTYPLFYQPYISLVIDKLRVNDKIENTINAYNGVSDKKVKVLPSYYIRRVIERLYFVFNRNKPKLNYAELKYLKNKIDIVHIQHSYLFPKILGLLEIPKEERPKIVITLRGGDTYVKPWIDKRWLDFYKNSGNKIDMFITMSKHQKMYLQRWGVNEKNIKVIPISFGAKVNSSPKQVNPKKIKIISAFRMCWEKNIDGNIRVIKNLVDKGYNVQYDIFGDGHDMGQVYYLIERYNLEKFINVKGKIDNEFFKEILPNYDFYLQLSLSESAGATIIEAQSKGVPCIISNSDGMPEMIIDDQTGYSIPYYDTITASAKIIELHKNKEKYYKFSKKAIEFVNSKFSVEQETKSLLDLYKNLID